MENRLTSSRTTLIVTDQSASATTRPRFRYHPALDGLRALAVIAVIGVHYGLPGFSAGALGVDAFFVLSGFLITSLLLEEWRASGCIRLQQFYIRRILRLFPALFVLILAFAIFQPRREILYVLGYVTNWAAATGAIPVAQNPYLHLWSLSVEEQFYLLWPPLLYLMLRRRLPPGLLIAIPLVLSCASALQRAALAYAGVAPERINYGTDSRVDGLLMGAALAASISLGALTPNRARRLAPVATAVSFLLLLATRIFVMPAEQFLPFGGLTAFNLAVTVLVMLSVLNPASVISRVLSVRPLRELGKRSYGLYLWHYPVGFFVVRFLPFLHPAYAVAVALPLAWLITWLSYRYVEQPALRFKNRFGARVTHLRVGQTEPSGLPVSTASDNLKLGSTGGMDGGRRATAAAHGCKFQPLIR